MLTKQVCYELSYDDSFFCRFFCVKDSNCISFHGSMFLNNIPVELRMMIFDYFDKDHGFAEQEIYYQIFFQCQFQLQHTILTRERLDSFCELIYVKCRQNNREYIVRPQLLVNMYGQYLKDVIHSIEQYY